MRVRALLSVLLLLCAGCNFGNWRWLDHTFESRVLRVRSGDRYFFSFEENATTGYRWEATADNDDVEVRLEHVAGDTSNGLVGAPGQAKGEIRVHRGFDGPAEVIFRYKRSWEKEPIRQFSVTLYKEQAERAFWE